MEQKEQKFKDLRIIYVIEGELNVEYWGKQNSLIGESFLIVNPGEVYSIHCKKDTLYCEIEIEYRWLCNITGNRNLVFKYISSKEENLTEVTLLNQLIEWHVCQNEKSNLYGGSILYKLLDIFIKKYTVADYQWMDQKKNRIQPIKAFLYTHYQESITLSELAESVHFSDAYLSRYFKQETGITFRQYLNKIRVEQAAMELKNTEKSVTQIALDCGFSTPSAFNRKFREFFEMTPATYRKKYLPQKTEKNIQDKKALDRIAAYYRTHAIKDVENSIVSEENVKVQANNRKKSRKKIKCLLNAGSASVILQSDMQQHILWMKHKVGIEYLRFWAPFSRQMVYVQDGEYDFSKLDKVLDFLVEQQICPFIDLGNKPRRIQKSAMESVLFEEGDIIEGLDEWENLLKQWVFHLKERYGQEEVGRWYFELWRNENRVDWMEEFLDGFDIAYHCIKEKIPDANVGGYGIKVSDYDVLLNDLKVWTKHCLPDFISAYFYAYENHEENDNYIVRRSSDSFFGKKLYNKIKKMQDETEMEKIPIYATEWNISISDRNVINDTCARAAYYLHNQIEWAEEDTVLGYFYASDCLSEFTDSKAPIFGGAGLITRNGIFKPAAYAVQFMNKCQQYIIKRGNHYLITTNNEDNYAIVCENYKDFNYRYYLKEEDEIGGRENLFSDSEMLALQFQIENMRNGIYEVRKFSVNTSHGSVYDEWERLGFLNQISYEDIEYLRHICVPQIHAERKKVENEALEFCAQLAPNEISYIQIKFLY